METLWFPGITDYYYYFRVYGYGFVRYFPWRIILTSVTTRNTDHISDRRFILLQYATILFLFSMHIILKIIQLIYLFIVKNFNESQKEIIYNKETKNVRKYF